MKRFGSETLDEVFTFFKAELSQLSPGDRFYFLAPDPDLGAGRYSGEELFAEGQTARHRGYGAWLEIAQFLGCRLLTPRSVDGTQGILKFGFQKLDPRASFHECTPTEELPDTTEKYGTSSRFADIDKLEHPAFLWTFLEAIERVDLPDGASVLNIGVNTGGEFELLKRALGEYRFNRLHLLGIDHCRSAIESAGQHFTNPDHQFLCRDVNDLNEMKLSRFDLIMSIGTLHSPGIRDSKQLLMDLVQKYLAPAGSIILGFPNCRWRDGEVFFGAKTKNYSQPELSLLLKDIDFAKRYLQQHKFQVTITGKTYLCLTAKKVGR